MDFEKIEKSARLRSRVLKTVTYVLLTFWAVMVLPLIRTTASLSLLCFHVASPSRMAKVNGSPTFSTR